MYTSFFGFKEKPFSIVPNPAFLYPSPKHRIALTYLEYGLSQHIGFILLTGEIGIGKTTLLRHLLAGLDSSIEVAVLFHTNVSAGNLIKQVLREFEVEPAGSDKSKNLDLLNSLLIDKYSRGQRALLIIDEAQNLSLSSLEEVRMLSNLQTNTDNLLQIMLFGQPELRSRIQDPRLAQLAQRIAVSYHLSPLNREETKKYIQHRIQSAGCFKTDLFSDEAMDLVHATSKGIPRSINILCDAALVYAYADELPSVELATMQQAIQDRYDEGVIPEGAVWVEPALQSTELPAGSGQGIGDLERIAALEKRVAEVAFQLKHFAQTASEQLEEEKNRLVVTLSTLLEQERKRSDRLLMQCSQYRKNLNVLASRETTGKKEGGNGEYDGMPHTPSSSQDEHIHKQQNILKKILHAIS